MTKPVPYSERRRLRRQRGDALMESLIGVVLLGVLGLGLSYATARTLNAQRYAATHGIAVSQMRGALETQGIKALCDGTQTAQLQVQPSGGDPMTVTMPAPNCTRANVTVGIAGDATLTAALPASSVVTKMQFITPHDDASAKQLLGAGSLELSQ